MSLALLFHYLLLNMFWMLIHPSSGCRVVLQPAYGYHTTTMQHQHTSNQNHTTHAITHQISCKLLRMDVLTSETCCAVNNEIIKQVTSSWSLFIQLSR